MKNITLAVGLLAILFVSACTQDKTASVTKTAGEASAVINTNAGSAEVGIRSANRSASNYAGIYEGTIDGRYAVRLLIQAVEGDSTLFGNYYYTSKGQLLTLKGHPEADSLTLREYGKGVNGPATATFRLAYPSKQELIGVWRAAGSAAYLPVLLHRYNGAVSGSAVAAQIRYRTELSEFKVPVITVPDAGVTRLLEKQLTLENISGNDRAELRNVAAAHLRGESGGYDLGNYEVTYNANGLLSINWHDEMVGASVTGRNSYRTFDLRTGFDIGIWDEIQPGRHAQFVALCGTSLRCSIRQYIKEQPGMDSTDLTGLQSQQVTADALKSAELAIESSAVRLTYYVEYEGLSNFMAKNLNDAFSIVIPFAELRKYLNSDSPLHRLFH
jgi:hypothetical protein